MTISKRNYDYFIRYIKLLNINRIDFKSYFLASKDKASYPLYPKYGLHWSMYGSCLAADSILRYIGANRKIKMRNMFWEKVSIDSPRGSDMDILSGMNLLFNPKQPKMAYPEVHFQPDSGKTKPNVLVVADSYYWNLYGLGISNAFSRSDFWYYNRTIYSSDPKENGLTMDKISLKDEISKHDVFIVLVAGRNVKEIGFGFIENVANLFKK